MKIKDLLCFNPEAELQLLGSVTPSELEDTLDAKLNTNNIKVTNNGNNIVPITEPIDVLTPSNGKLIISNATHSIVISKLGFIMLLKILAIPSTSPATILFVFKNRLYAKAYKNNPTDNVKYLLISCLYFITTPHP